MQAFRITSNDPSLSYPDLAKALGTPVSIVPADPKAALTDAGWWLSQLKSAGSKGQAPVLAQFLPLAGGLHAEEERESEAFTEFDGYVPAAGKILDPCDEATLVSPTQLEAAADCAFRHFLQRGLGIRAVDEREKDGDTWLDAGTRGSDLPPEREVVAIRLAGTGKEPRRHARRSAGGATVHAWINASGHPGTDVVSHADCVTNPVTLIM